MTGCRHSLSLHSSLLSLTSEDIKHFIIQTHRELAVFTLNHQLTPNTALAIPHLLGLLDLLTVPVGSVVHTRLHTLCLLLLPGCWDPDCGDGPLTLGPVCLYPLSSILGGNSWPRPPPARTPWLIRERGGSFGHMPIISVLSNNIKRQIRTSWENINYFRSLTHVLFSPLKNVHSSNCCCCCL